MYCRKCGAEIKDDSTFCPACGESTAFVDGTASAPAVYASSRKYKIIGIAAVAAVIAIAAAVVLSLVFSGRSSRETVDDFVECVYEDVDGEDFLELLPAQLAHDEFGIVGSLENDISERYVEAELYSMRQDLRGEYRVKYKIVNTDKYNDGELSVLRENMRSQYGIVPSAARDITISYTIKDTAVSGRTLINLVKLGRSWYIIGVSDVSNDPNAGPVI